MKNRACALALTVAILAAIAVCFLRPGTSDAAWLDVRAADTRERVETEGDSTLVQVENCGFDFELYSGMMLNIRSRTSDTYALTNKTFCDGRIVEPRESESAVVIERLENGEWVRWRGLDFEEDGLAGRTYAPVISEKESECVKMFFPAHIPGKYRITLSFRDASIDERGHISTSGEAHSVSFCCDVGEWQDFGRFKAAASIKQISETQAAVAVAIDGGDKAAPFRDTSNAELTLWENAANCDAYAIASESPEYVRNLYLAHYGYGEDEGSESVASYLVSLRDLDMSEDYNLTLHFVEHPDGSGARYTLALRLRFDEIAVDEVETARLVALYTGSELAASRGWSDEYLAEHFVAVRARYYVEYDHEKTFLPDGEIEQYFYLVEDVESGEWTIVDNTSGAALG